MNSNIHPEAENSDATATEIPDTFKRRLMSSRRRLCPRRYVIALMLFLLLFIKHWRSINVRFTVMQIYIDVYEQNPDIDFFTRKWSLFSIMDLNHSEFVINLLAQIPGAILIYYFGSYKYFLISTVATSILDILAPTALEHHSDTLLVLLVADKVIAAATFTAVISMWKDWAPPLERTKLMVFSVSGVFFGYRNFVRDLLSLDIFTSFQSYYITGAAGLIWALIWCTTISDTPQNDPLISENELLYLEASIPADIEPKGSLKDIPWKSILSSKQIIILSIIFFKTSVSSEVIEINTMFITFILSPLYVMILFLCASCIIIASSAVLADYLINKFSGRTLMIRKFFLCGGFFLQSILLFGSLLTVSPHMVSLFVVMAYIMYAASFPGFQTIALDLSPRYVAIIVGILQTSYYIGSMCIDVLEHTTELVTYFDSMHWLFFIDGIVSLFCAALFVKWADVEEQPWSLRFSTSQYSVGYRSYPSNEDQDELNLVQENNF